MNIYIANKKSKLENIQKRFPDAMILDITSTSKYEGLRRLSPFYPHGNIPVPGMPNIKAASVEGVWQGLKIFENQGVDLNTLRNDTMKNIKRTVRKNGYPLGHKYGDKIPSYEEARWEIYLPTYLYVLENVPSVRYTLSKIQEQLNKTDIVFLDYNTNCNIEDYSAPLSHAALVKLFLEGKYPIASRIRTNNTNVTFYEIEKLIRIIIEHPKYDEKKHNRYIDEIQGMQTIDWKEIKAISPKRDGWKTLIDEVKKISSTRRSSQLSLF